MFWAAGFWASGFWADDFWIGLTTASGALSQQTRMLTLMGARGMVRGKAPVRGRK